MDASPGNKAKIAGLGFLLQQELLREDVLSASFVCFFRLTLGFRNAADMHGRFPLSPSKREMSLVIKPCNSAFASAPLSGNERQEGGRWGRSCSPCQTMFQILVTCLDMHPWLGTAKGWHRQRCSFRRAPLNQFSVNCGGDTQRASAENNLEFEVSTVEWTTTDPRGAQKGAGLRGAKRASSLGPERRQRLYS